MIKTSRTSYDGNKFGKGGEIVCRVMVDLMFGDDFNLELFYLPKAQTLAAKFAIIETMGALARGCTETLPDAPEMCRNIKGFLDDTLNGSAQDAFDVTTGGLPYPDDLGPLAEMVVETMINAANVAEIAGVTTLRLVHAVNRPLSLPVLKAPVSVLRPKAVEPPRPEKPAADATEEKARVLERARNAEKADSLSVPGSKDYLLCGPVEFDGMTTGAIEIEAVTANPRDSLFDDRTRQRQLTARLSGTWQKRADSTGRRPATIQEVYGFDAIDPVTGKVTLVRSRVRLLRIDHIGVALNGEIALDKAHTAARHGLPFDKDSRPYAAAQLHAFPDGCARRLSLRAVAVSRFATDFTTAPFWDDAGSPARVLLRQELQAPDLQQVGVEIGEVWLPASIRQAKCVAASAIPMIKLDESASVARGVWTGNLTRHARTRIYLERGWFSSGEGERLGLVLWPPNLMNEKGRAENKVLVGDREIDVRDLRDQDLGPGGAFVTRCGGDPIRKDRFPMQATLMPASAFRDHREDGIGAEENPHRPELVRCVRIPVPLPEEPGAATGPGSTETAFLSFTASLLTYEPCFDIDREQWFVDIDIDLPLTADPFVRFGLVRYQRHALEGLEASEPIALWTQLLPDRSVEVTSRWTAKQWQVVGVRVHGTASIAFHEIKPTEGDVIRMVEKNDPLALLRTPFMSLRLVHESRSGTHVRRSEIPLGPDGRLLEVQGSKDPQLQSEWRFGSFPLPQDILDDLGPGELYLYLEERDRRMPAAYAKEPVAQAEMFDPEGYVASGPRFAARIAIPSLPVAPEGKPAERKAEDSKPPEARIPQPGLGKT